MSESLVLQRMQSHSEKRKCLIWKCSHASTGTVPSKQDWSAYYYIYLWLVPSNKCFTVYAQWCFPSETDSILLLLFTLSSFPFTSSDRAGLQPRARATSTFVGFYCYWEEAIAIERVLATVPDTDRWEPGLQMVRGSMGGRGWRSKTHAFPRWLSSSHHACLPGLTVYFLACLWGVLSSMAWSMA